nr:MAG TPA: hypothetical protein [Caudoviricetes sp.]
MTLTLYLRNNIQLQILFFLFCQCHIVMIYIG